MEKRRTVPVKLDVDGDDAALLEDTVDEFLWAANYVTRYAFDGEYVTTSKTTLHDDTYEDVRDETRLHSGTLNANGEYEPPAEDSARAGVHAESQRL